MKTVIKQPDFFGGETAIPTERDNYVKEFRSLNNYRNRITPMESCAKCKYSFQHEFSKTYRKCELIGVTGSQNTDVSQNKVCNKFKPITK